MFSRLSLPQLGTVLVKTAVVGQEEGGAGLAGVDCALLGLHTFRLKIIKQNLTLYILCIDAV